VSLQFIENVKQCRTPVTAFLLKESESAIQLDEAPHPDPNMEKPMDLKDIKAIIDLMKKNSISEFELERQDFKIRLKRGMGATLPAYEDAVMPMTIPAASTAPAIPITTTPAPAVVGLLEVKSPMIGTFYRAPSPESGNYVELGSEVNPDTVVCIIEAMKVMNEIKAETRGVVKEVLVENATPVEFGQPLFLIQPR
jgi:acetyl-CoA carboxylase biotin carboxyl carrier protein